MRLHNKTMQHFESGVYSTLVLLSPGLGTPESDRRTKTMRHFASRVNSTLVLLQSRTRTLRANQAASALIGSM
jgi:hypothetical protein